MKNHSPKYWIKNLDLKKHPEGGYFKEIYRSDKKIKIDKEIRTYYTSIYYLLEGNDFSSFHKIKCDEIWNFFTGSSITLYLIDDKTNQIQKKILGPNFEHKNYFQILVPANTWFAAKVNDAKSYSLVGCIVSPGFEFYDFVIGQRNELEINYPSLKNWIRKFTK